MILKINEKVKRKAKFRSFCLLVGKQTIPNYKAVQFRIYFEEKYSINELKSKNCCPSVCAIDKQLHCCMLPRELEKVEYKISFEKYVRCTKSMICEIKSSKYSFVLAHIL